MVQKNLLPIHNIGISVQILIILYIKLLIHYKRLTLYKFQSIEVKLRDDVKVLTVRVIDSGETRDQELRCILYPIFCILAGAIANCVPKPFSIHPNSNTYNPKSTQARCLLRLRRHHHRRRNLRRNAQNICT